MIRVMWYVWGMLEVVLGALLAYEGVHFASGVFLLFGAGTLAIAAWVLT